MRLSELVSNLTPSAFAQIALLLFLAVFAAVALRTLGGRARHHAAEQAALPLVDDSTPHTERSAS
jgi:cbb3-type cytochrome oxidase subunit 3